MRTEPKVAVVGLGYVGLVTGACLAHIGHRVACVDKDGSRVAALESGRPPLYEPRLEELVVNNGSRLCFTTELSKVVQATDIIFVCVGTPSKKDSTADLTNVVSVARQVGRALAGSPPRERPLIVVNKSTVPVGSGDYVSGLIRDGAAQAGGDANGSLVVSNPEFLREGNAIYDTLFPDRIVVGTVSVPFVVTDPASAEMIKYASNVFLATKISFINEISNLCELTGVDVASVATGIGLDGRIGPRFLNAGIGWGAEQTAIRAIVK